MRRASTRRRRPNGWTRFSSPTKARRRSAPRPAPPHSNGALMSVWAVIVAAGRGDRLALDRPKAFAKLNGRPLLAESLERLEWSEWIDAIAVAAPPDWEEPVILLAEELGCGKVVSVVAGGKTRADSVRAGLAEVAEDAAVVLVHDA